MKRVAVISVHSCPLAALGGKETGGMNVYVRELSRQMGRAGLRVDVFTRSQNPHISPIVSLGRNARVVHLQAGPAEPLPKGSLLQYMPEFTSSLVRFAEEEEIRYDLLHSHYWLSGWVGSRLKREWGIPLVHMFHTLGALKNSVARKREEREPRRRLTVEREILGFADRVVAPSPWEKEQMMGSQGPSSDKVKVIPCGVDLELFHPIPSLSAKKHLGLFPRKFVLFVGRIEPIKGIDVLIRAIQDLSRRSLKGDQEAGLIIIGGELDTDPRAGSQEMQKLRKMVVEMKLQERVAFWGAQRQDLLPYFYSAAEALVLPSRYESFGMVALEAMACGTPVIASRVGGLQYTVKEGRTGFLVPEGNWSLLADRIRKVVENPSLRKKMGAEAMARARQFSWPVITQRILSLYKSIEEAKPTFTGIRAQKEWN